MNNYLIFLKFILTNNTLLRVLQIYKCLGINLIGLSLEFGAINNKDKTFSNFFKGSNKFHYTNLVPNKELNIFYSDLTKKIKISKNKYKNILIFNILEHLPKYDLAFSETHRILKKGGYLIGSVPFLYQVHGAPNDYFRFTKDSLNYNLVNNKFKKIKVIALGYGPFVASYSLIHSYIKFIPFFSQIILLTAYILDSFIQIFVKTKLNEIFPIGYFFIAKK
jgi:SAM-dependent methyltransferase